jgi:hypothetical protein
MLMSHNQTDDQDTGNIKTLHKTVFQLVVFTWDPAHADPNSADRHRHLRFLC